jgi:hypothetical protein
MITNDIIKSLNPCKDRLDNYLKFYEDKEHTKAQFMELKNITHEDKLWVAFRLMTRDQVIKAVADIAESVLHIFEKKYPNDPRPRKAIEAARICDVNSAPTAAAYAAAAAATYAAADDATYAAAYAATAAAYAAADDGAYAAAAYAATAAAAAAAPNKEVQEKLIRKIVLRYWK